MSNTENNEQLWAELEEQTSACRRCPLGSTRTNCVLGCGDRNADLMFIGEAPGESEDLSGVPFVGRAGKLLDKYLEAVGIERDSVYICNILKCRPPQNRDPQPDEEEACIGYLRRQVRLVKPKIIVCLGRISGAKLIDPNLKITKDHGRWIKKGDFWMTAVYHPSFLLRPNAGAREQMLTDMKSVKAKLDELGGDTEG